MRSKALIAVLALAAAAVALPAACASPAQFMVKTVTLNPSSAKIGQAVNVTAEVACISEKGGRYRAALTVDGMEIDTSYIDLTPGSVANVAFTVSEDKAGDYEIGVGGRTAVLTVLPNLVPKEVELRYDSGEAVDYLSLVKPCTGYLVAFNSPSDLFYIKKVSVYGLVYASPGYHVSGAQLQVWDKNKKVIFTMPFSGDDFPLYSRIGENLKITGTLVDTLLPNVPVQGNFYINIYTGVPTGQGFRMAATDSRKDQHSDVTIRDENGVDSIATTWPYSMGGWFGDKSRVNWVVRVVGDAMVPGQ